MPALSSIPPAVTAKLLRALPTPIGACKTTLAPLPAADIVSARGVPGLSLSIVDAAVITALMSVALRAVFSPSVNAPL